MICRIHRHQNSEVEVEMKSFDGDKSAEFFDYCTAKGTPATSSAILSQRSIFEDSITLMT